MRKHIKYSSVICEKKEEQDAARMTIINNPNQTNRRALTIE